MMSSSNFGTNCLRRKLSDGSSAHAFLSQCCGMMKVIPWNPLEFRVRHTHTPACSCTHTHTDILSLAARLWQLHTSFKFRSSWCRKSVASIRLWQPHTFSFRSTSCRKPVVSVAVISRLRICSRSAVWECALLSVNEAATGLHRRFMDLAGNCTRTPASSSNFFFFAARLSTTGSARDSSKTVVLFRLPV